MQDEWLTEVKEIIKSPGRGVPQWGYNHSRIGGLRLATNCIGSPHHLLPLRELLHTNPSQLQSETTHIRTT